MEDSVKYWRGRDGTYHDTAGENSRTSKITDEIVRDIRNRKESARIVGELYGIHLETVKKIRRREEWSHVK